MAMIKRRLSQLKIPHSKNRFLLDIHNSVIRNSSVDYVWTFYGNEFDEFNNIEPQLSFTEEEERKGRDVLSGMGIDSETPFVCFHTRDKAYLDIIHSHQTREQWSYHDHRDCDINNYELGIRYLADFGYIALRTGQVVKSELSYADNVRIIDYSCNYRNDFADMYLNARCAFFVGGCSGLREVPQIFNVPMVEPNIIPLRYVPRGDKSLFIPKKLWDKQRKRLLTFPEILSNGIDDWKKAQRYVDGNIEIIENTSHEILDVVKEMNKRHNGTWIGENEDEELQDRFRSLFLPDHPYHGFPSRIGAEFLRQNRSLLDG